MSPAPILLLAYTSQLGGAERSLLEATARLDRARFSPILAMPCAGPLADEAHAHGIDVFLDGTPRLERLGPADWARVVGRLARLVREREVRLIHAGTLWRLTRAAALARLTGVPAIGHVRDLEPQFFRSARFRLAAASMRRLIAISSAVGRELESAGQPAARIAVLWNGIDPSRFEPLGRRAELRAEWGVGAQDPLVGMVAGIEPRKGPLDFVEMAALLSSERPDARFVLVGGDLHGVWSDHRAQLEHRIDERGLRERVVLAGRRDDVPDVMSAFDVLVVPSRQEPFGRVVIEAMAAAKPVVAYAVGGIPEIVVADVTGVLCGPGDVRALAAGVGEILRAPDRARSFGAAGRARVHEHFTLERHVEALSGLYGRLQKRRE